MTAHHSHAERRRRRRCAPTILGLLGLSLALWAVGCDDEPAPTDAGDPCGGRCLTELGEVCDPDTGTCYFPSDVGDDVDNDMGVDADVPPDVPDEPDCVVDDQCDADEYCNPEGECVYGCRTGDDDNCNDCDIFPATCEDDLACHPTDHECVSGCFDDTDCDSTRFCHDETGLCQRGCRLSPDNCLDITGDDTFACDETTRLCLDGDCTGEGQCPEGSICQYGLCTWGCRTTPDSCGAGSMCHDASRTCVPQPCTCDPEDSNETCDSLCDEAGAVSGFYCNRDTLLCEWGCRIRDDASDTCSLGTICDEVDHICVDGCYVDETCPFMTYCSEDNECVSGCKLGECDEQQFCDLDTRRCTSQSCDDDEDCPDVAYCSAGGVCLEGCRAVVDNCPDDLVCNPATHECRVPTCSDHVDCPLNEYCDIGGSCQPGCAGMDSRCPAGQPCSDLTGFCGCLGDADCGADTHCVTPDCVVDCFGNDDCPDPLLCDIDSGRCVGDCTDSEGSARNDTPETATCVMFDLDDKFDPEQLRLCQAGETHLPPTSYCDETAGTYCFEGVACTGGDVDWYTMYLEAGDPSCRAAAPLSALLETSPIKLLLS